MTKKRLFEVAIVFACVLYGAFISAASKPSGFPLVVDLLFGIFGGLIIGWATVGLLRLILLLARKFRTSAPKTALYTGKTFYWLGCGIAVFSLGLAAWQVYIFVSGPISPWASSEIALFNAKFILKGIGLAVFYWALGWGIRHILTPDGAPPVSSGPVVSPSNSAKGAGAMRILRMVLIVLSVLGTLMLIALTAQQLNRYRVQPVEIALLIGCVLALIANIFYLSRTAPKGTPSRLARLFNLWIDAKEQEFKDRVSQK